MFDFFNRLRSILGPSRATPSVPNDAIRNRRFRPCLEVLEDRLVLSTLQLSGTFNMETVGGAVGTDLASILGHDNGWSVTLSDVTYENYRVDSGDRGYYAATGVVSPSFQIEFTGPDAALLNDVVGRQLTQGGGPVGGYTLFPGEPPLTGPTFLDVISTGASSEWFFTILPEDPQSGISFQAAGGAVFPMDSSGYPLIQSMTLTAASTELIDRRPGNDGGLTSTDDPVEVVRSADAGFVWQTPWEVSFATNAPYGGGETRVAFGAAATTDGQITDVGQAGDQGPARATARALAYAGPETLVAADVLFERTFQLSDSPAGWQLSLEGFLTGVLSGYAGFIEDQGYANVSGAIRVDAGTVGGVGEPVLSLHLADDVLVFADTSVEKSVSQAVTAEGLVFDGTYTVSGVLHTEAYSGWATRSAYGTAQSSFFDPPGLLVNLDAIPWDGSAFPAVTINDVSLTEGNTATQAAVFTVSLSGPSTQPVTVTYSTAAGTATTGADYAASSGSITFAPGEVTKSITVPVTGDRLGEPNETFVVNLIGATNAAVTDDQGIATITDDEPRISISDVTKVEGKKGQSTLFTFTVTLSTAYDQAVTMSFGTVNGTATSGSGDYIAKTGTLTFAPGETTKTITMEVKGDSKKEADETFYLDLFDNSDNSLFTKKRGIGTILNDD
jgi:hypothetical protein